MVSLPGIPLEHPTTLPGSPVNDGKLDAGAARRGREGGRGGRGREDVRRRRVWDGVGVGGDHSGREMVVSGQWRSREQQDRSALTTA